MACNRITTPNAGPMQACYDGYQECTESTVCRGAACPRTCQAPGAPGDTCQFDSDCRPLLYCKRTVQVTGAGICTGLGTVNSTCTRDEPCTAGLACAGGHCVVPPSAGTYCAVGDLCDDVSWCKFTPDGGVCVAKEGNNAPCTDDVQCMSGFICQNNRCESRVLALTNTPCSDRQTCPMGTICVGATTMQLGRCSAPLDAGQSCIASDDCLKHLACSGVDGGLTLACAWRQPNLAPCSVDHDCQLLSRCKGGICRRLPAVGQSCLEERACATGPCMALLDAGYVCAEKYGPGERCLADSDCASNRCVGNSCLPTCAP
jgi:hypothetical protein